MRSKKLRFALLGAAAIMMLTAGQCPNEPGVENERDVGETSADIPTNDVIVFTRRSRVEETYDLWRMNSNRTGQRRISSTPNVDERKPRLSPDGTRVAYEAGGDIFVMNLDGSDVRNLTAGARFDRPEVGPAWASTGNTIAFAGSRDNDYDIYTVPVTGSNDPNRIVDEPGDQMYPDLSPDGTQVIFQSELNDRYWDLRAGPSGGNGPITTLHECPRSFPKCFVQHARFSHDGTKIAFWRLGSKDDSGLYILPAAGGELVFRGIPGGLGSDPVAWSPDDSEIAVIEDVADNITAYPVTPPGGRNLVTCQCRFHDGIDWNIVSPLVTIKDASRTEGDSGTQNMRFLIQLSGRSDSTVSVDVSTESRDGGATELIDFNAGSATISIPAGQTTAYFNVEIRGDNELEDDERFHVLLSNPQGGQLGRRKAYGKILDDDKPPPPSPSPSSSPSPSPSPSASPSPTGPGAIAYQVGHNEVWLMNADGSDQHKLVDGGTPDWKPDGSKVAFFEPTVLDIFEIAPAGGAATKVNGTPDFDGSPSWAPDGSGISWTRIGGGAPDVYKAEPPTGTPQPVATSASAEYNQDWDVLHDGTEVMAMTKDGAIVFVNPDTGAQIGGAVVPASESADNPAISPDGTRLAYNSSLHGDPDIFVLNLTTPGTPAAHLTTSSAEDVAPTWSPDGSMLAFASNRTGNFEIFTMDAATGANQLNRTNASGDDVEPAWGPAGTTASAATGAAETTEVTPSPSPQPSPSPSGTTAGVIFGIPSLVLGSVLIGRRRRPRRAETERPE